VLLVHSHRDGRLMNQWAADHTHALVGAVPILALDMYEHSHHIDYGAKAGAYVDGLHAEHPLERRGGASRGVRCEMNGTMAEIEQHE